MYTAIIKDTTIIIAPRRSTSPHPPSTTAAAAQKFKGSMSPRTRSKIRGFLFAWHEAAKHKHRGKHGLVAITLTLSDKQKHSDKEIKSIMLNQFLTELRTQHEVKNYYWVAEAQENGNIHFHILIDKFFSKETLTRVWNRIQQKAGYIPANADLSNKKYPSTNIQKVKSASGTAAYMSKYVTKDEEGRRKIEGRLWSASREITQLGNCKLEISDEEATAIIDSADTEDIVEIPDTEVKIILPKYRQQIIKKMKIFRSALVFWKLENYVKLYDKPLHEEAYQTATSAIKTRPSFQTRQTNAPAAVVCPF